MNDRVVEPFSFTANMIDVWAYDVEKADSRVFKVSRVGTVEALEEEYLWRKGICTARTASGYRRYKNPRTGRG